MLKGIKVIEFEGLAPTVFAGMMLSDYGAQVILINKVNGDTDTLMNRGKQSMTFDLKNATQLAELKVLIKSANILLDPYRPGVLEKLGLSYDDIGNQSLIYCRVSCFGQDSPLKDYEGHDLNFIALSGALSVCAGKDDTPAIPANLIGDFACGGAMAVAAILAALHHVTQGGKGQIIDLGMSQASLYLSQFILDQKRKQQWNQPRGQNVLDGGAHFYQVYICKDGKYYSVACIESKFYDQFIKVLKNTVPNQNLDYLAENQFDISKWTTFKEEIQKIFIQKTRDEWNAIFHKVDACCFPVMELEEQLSNPFLGTVAHSRGDAVEALRQPQFSGFKDNQLRPIPTLGAHNSPKL